jgi:hypothetical protein
MGLTSMYSKLHEIDLNAQLCRYLDLRRQQHSHKNAHWDQFSKMEKKYLRVFKILARKETETQLNW